MSVFATQTATRVSTSKIVSGRKGGKDQGRRTERFSHGNRMFAACSCVVYADDDKAGYSQISTGAARDSQVEITPENPKGELNILLPPKAGFIRIHLKNRNTGDAISTMAILVARMETPDSLLFTMSCY